MEPKYPFKIFSENHLIVMVIIFAIGALLMWRGSRNKEEKFLGWIIAGIILCSEYSEAALALYSRAWHVSWALPLHLCDLSLYALVIALIFRNQIAWELAFYWGIGGSLPAVLTPDIPFDFPYYIFITFFIHHGGIVVGALYLASQRRYPLPFASLKRIWMITHIYAAFIFVFNGIMGTNYLFLCEKPSQPSLLDYLGPWPIYLLGLECVFLIVIFLLYGLYHLTNRRDRKPLK